MDKFISKLSEKLHMMFFYDEKPTSDKLISNFFVHENGNEFDTKYYDLLVELITYIYSQEHSLNELSDEEIPEIMPSDQKNEMLFSEFRNKLRSYIGKETPQTGEVNVEKQDYYTFIHDLVVNNLLKEEGFWNRIDSSKLRIVDNKTPDIARLFIPVNNSNLYLFSTLFILKCEERDIDFNFKVTTDSSKQLGNSLEINVNIKNYEVVLDIINNIINDYPGIFIDRDKLPIISYPLSNEVGVVPIIYDGLFEEKLCNDIVYLKQKTRHYGEFKDELGNFVKYYFKPIINEFKKEEENTNKKLH